jgi:hypothetical protein
MSALTSTCNRHFGHADFDLSRVGPASPSCPVRDCSEPLVKLLYGKQHDRKRAPKERTKSWCPIHGIRLHSGTFVYWNGPNAQKKAQLRNFIVEPDLAGDIAMKPGAKAEAHRLGYEMSEDALSWNVFVSLAVAGKLKKAGEWFTGRRLSSEPELYLWGKRIDPIDVKNNERGTYEALQGVRDNLEVGIKRFVTEPDIMLVVKDEMVICIEAKFGSGNSLAHEGTIKDGNDGIGNGRVLGGVADKDVMRSSIRMRHCCLDRLIPFPGLGRILRHPFPLSRLPGPASRMHRKREGGNRPSVSPTQSPRSPVLPAPLKNGNPSLEQN